MLAQYSPMGWNSWNTFGENISEELILQTADAMVDTGLRDAGYEYLVIDDCWSKRRRENGLLVADPDKFPHGMKYVADYVHAKGLKFGMYSCAGTMTCGSYPGSFDHEYVDAQTFADFGVDFLKYDFCNKPTTINGPMLYRRMGMALKATGREILFSACNWGSDEVGRWIRSTGAHMYRSTGDIADNFQSCKDIVLSQLRNFCYSAPGCYNDMDMLTVGMYGVGHVGLGGCSDLEYRTQFLLWCLFQAPLMIGCDVRHMTPQTQALLTHPELLRLHKDEEARPPFVVTDRNHWDPGDEVPSTGKLSLFKHLADGAYAMAFVNFTDSASTVVCNFFDLGLPAASGFGFMLTDLLTGETVGPVEELYSVPLEAHDCRVFRAELVRV